MPIISAMEPQKKNSERLNIYVDGCFVLGVSVETATKLRLAVGKDFSRDELAAAAAEDDYFVALGKAIDSIARGDKSEYRITSYLEEKGFTDVIPRVLARLRELDLVNDVRLAQKTVSTQSAKGAGRYLIAQKLRQCGITDDIARDAMEVLNDTEDGDAAAAAKALRRKYHGADAEKKIAAALVRKGFPWEVAYAAARTENEE